MRILITGGAGFIGSHLCERLIGEGHSVVCIDDLSTGRRENIEKLLEENQRFDFYEWDVCHPIGDARKYDRIYNLACPASPAQYQANPLKTIRTNVLGAINVCDFAMRLPGVRVLQASTSEVYGDPTQHPQSEQYWGHVNPVGPRACYDEGKRMAETVFTEYRNLGLDVRIARIFNTYGQRMRIDDGRVVSNFMAQAIRGEPITVYGDGTQTRSFCYVEDMVEGLVKLMESGPDTPVNLGNPHEISILQLARHISNMVGGVEIHELALPEDDPMRRKPDISLAATFGWQPMIDVDTGLRLTFGYFKRELTDG